MGLLEKLSGLLGARSAGSEVCVLVLGLDRSGKTALLEALRSPDERRAPAAPDHHTFHSGGVTFSAWEAGGALRHRALWERHYRRAQAVIFVVDAGDRLRLVVAREELQLVVSHPDVCGRRVPLLVCANKSDLPHALSAPHLANALGLERITSQPWHVCATSAVGGAGGAVGAGGAGGTGLAEGLSWLARQLRDLHAPH